MAHDFLTWGNFITWVVCSILIYLSLNFRLYMTFHHPGRKLKAKARERILAKRMAADRESSGYKPGTQVPVWDRKCPEGAACYMDSGDHPDKGARGR